MEPRVQVGVSLGDALGGRGQTIPLRVFAYGEKDLPHGTLYAWPVYAAHFSQNRKQTDIPKS